MTSYFNVRDVTIANPNHKNYLYFVCRARVHPTLKKIPPPRAMCACTQGYFFTYQIRSEN